MANTMASTSPNTTVLRDGYDLPLYGIDNGKFLAIHVPALVCIVFSLLSALGVLICSFSHRSYKTFFHWTKSERFVVYLAICDALFNICHSMDHLHITITRANVDPKELCEFYAFMLTEFITAQNLMVNIVSINAFVLIYFRKNLSFGKNDIHLLLWTFGLPFLATLIAAILGSFGPNGAFCYFDGVKGEIASITLTTIPLVIILLVNVTLYTLTWIRIRHEEPRFKMKVGKDANIIRGSHRAARTMSLFVTAFIIQWTPLAIHGVYHMTGRKISFVLFQLVVTFSNIGGILNGIVYIIIRRRTREHQSSDTNAELVKSSQFKRQHSNPASPTRTSSMYVSSGHLPNSIPTTPIHPEQPDQSKTMYLQSPCRHLSSSVYISPVHQDSSANGHITNGKTPIIPV